MTRLENFWERRLNIAEGKVQALEGTRRYLEKSRSFDCPQELAEWVVNELEAAQEERRFLRRKASVVSFADEGGGDGD